jgi:hypothetical protein
MSGDERVAHTGGVVSGAVVDDNDLPAESLLDDHGLETRQGFTQLLAPVASSDVTDRSKLKSARCSVSCTLPGLQHRATRIARTRQCYLDKVPPYFNGKRSGRRPADVPHLTVEPEKGCATRRPAKVSAR